MFDCGEGTQRQMMHAGLGFNRSTIIMISHLHGRMHKLEPGAVDVDVNGVGDLVRVPIADWDQLLEGASVALAGAHRQIRVCDLCGH